MSTESNSLFATVGTTDSTIMGANLGRTYLTISPPPIGRVSFQFGRPAVLDQGLTIIAGTPPLRLSYRNLGADIQGEIHAIADAAARVISIVEAFSPRP